MSRWASVITNFCHGMPMESPLDPQGWSPQVLPLCFHLHFHRREMRDKRARAAKDYCAFVGPLWRELTAVLDYKATLWGALWWPALSPSFPATQPLPRPFLMHDWLALGTRPCLLSSLISRSRSTYFMPPQHDSPDENKSNSLDSSLFWEMLEDGLELARW